MSFLSLVGVEFQKIRRSRIILILLAAAVILWLPSVLNADMNFRMQAEGISPENNFFIQGFLGMTWFMFPSSMVVGTVLLSQTERANNGIIKMLALPISAAKLFMAKFTVLMFLAAAQILMTAGMYFLSAAAASRLQSYAFMLPPFYVLKEAALIFASSIPMLAFFMLLSVCIQTPVFSVSIGLASLVPSVLMINTRIWFAYPMSYPFFLITTEYGRLASRISAGKIESVPWIPFAVGFTLLCLTFSCLRFGRAERK